MFLQQWALGQRPGLRWTHADTHYIIVNSPPGLWWEGYKLPVFLLFSVQPSKGTSARLLPYLWALVWGLTLWLNDAHINHHGRGGLMRLVIALIPKEKTAFFWNEMPSLTQHWSRFTSVCSNHPLNWELGAWKEGTPNQLFAIPSGERMNVSCLIGFCSWQVSTPC